MNTIEPAQIGGGDIWFTQGAVQNLLAARAQLELVPEARYNIVMAVQLYGKAGQARCLIRNERSLLMEVDPLGPDPEIRHYFWLVEQGGVWLARGNVLIMKNSDGRTPYQRAAIVRHAF